MTVEERIAVLEAKFAHAERSLRETGFNHHARPVEVIWDLLRAFVMPLPCPRCAHLMTLRWGTTNQTVWTCGKGGVGWIQHNYKNSDELSVHYEGPCNGGLSNEQR